MRCMWGRRGRRCRESCEGSVASLSSTTDPICDLSGIFRLVPAPVPGNWSCDSTIVAAKAPAFQPPAPFRLIGVPRPAYAELASEEEEINKALEKISQKQEFVQIVSLILKVLRDPEFPKRDKKARINFLADSLAARGAVTPRTSRDICARERKRERKKSTHRIIRREFYIECSCGYKVRHAITLAANAALKSISYRKYCWDED
jgi:hypothetical protein